MSKSLRNIDALKKMLAGEHKSQTRQTFGFTETAKERREVGDKWVDADGVEWEQKEGYRINTTKVLDEIKGYIMPKMCPKCGNEMKKTKANTKMWNVHKMCLDCVVKMEHNLRIEGKYEEYQKEKVRANVEAWIKEAETEVNDIVNEMTKDLSFANSDGTLEKWDNPIKDKEEFRKKVFEEFEQFKKDLLTKVEQK